MDDFNPIHFQNLYCNSEKREALLNGIKYPPLHKSLLFMAIHARFEKMNSSLGKVRLVKDDSDHHEHQSRHVA